SQSWPRAWRAAGCGVVARALTGPNPVGFDLDANRRYARSRSASPARVFVWSAVRTAPSRGLGPQSGPYDSRGPTGSPSAHSVHPATLVRAESWESPPRLVTTRLNFGLRRSRLDGPKRGLHAMLRVLRRGARGAVLLALLGFCLLSQTGRAQVSGGYSPD